MDVEWGFYDRKGHVDESFRRMPHKDQAGAVTFVTMRLADSMPRHVVQKWHLEVQAWLDEHGFCGMSTDEVLLASEISSRIKRDLRRFKNQKWHSRLDNCFGACVLRNAEARMEVVKSFLHFNGDRYDLDRFVVMPNHVHVLIQMRDVGLRKQFRELQRYSARKINKILGRTGQLWQGEPFDHVVRNERQFEYLRSYIIDNPKKANLSSSEFTYWCGSQRQ